jgi:hypothetical protein
MDLIRKLFWVALTLVFTFGFIVLFENGTTNYVDNAKIEFAQMKLMFAEKPKKKADVSDQLK